jgi:ketosteroid isomerase-like protein
MDFVTAVAHRLTGDLHKRKPRPQHPLAGVKRPAISSTILRKRARGDAQAAAEYARLRPAVAAARLESEAAAERELLAAHAERVAELRRQHDLAVLLGDLPAGAPFSEPPDPITLYRQRCAARAAVRLFKRALRAALLRDYVRARMEQEPGRYSDEREWLLQNMVDRASVMADAVRHARRLRAAEAALGVPAHATTLRAHLTNARAEAADKHARAEASAAARQERRRARLAGGAGDARSVVEQARLGALGDIDALTKAQRQYLIDCQRTWRAFTDAFAAHQRGDAAALTELCAHGDALMRPGYLPRNWPAQASAAARAVSMDAVPLPRVRREPASERVTTVHDGVPDDQLTALQRLARERSIVRAERQAQRQAQRHAARADAERVRWYVYAATLRMLDVLAKAAGIGAKTAGELLNGRSASQIALDATR